MRLWTNTFLRRGEPHTKTHPFVQQASLDRFLSPDFFLLRFVARETTKKLKKGTLGMMKSGKTPGTAGELQEGRGNSRRVGESRGNSRKGPLHFLVSFCCGTVPTNLNKCRGNYISGGGRMVSREIYLPERCFLFFPYLQLKILLELEGREG